MTENERPIPSVCGGDHRQEPRPRVAATSQLY